VEYNLLFFAVSFALIIATIQDLKRREVDNWLNFGLLAFGLVFIVFMSIFNLDYWYLVNGVGIILVAFVFHYLFYFGHVFAGGDAKLLLAMSPFFASSTFVHSLFQLVVFVFLMFLCGGIYGLLYSAVLYFKSFKESNVRIKKQLVRLKFVWFLVLGVVLMVLGYFVFLSFVVGIFVILFPLLLAFARGLEEVVMIRTISGKSLREGDWLVEDVRVGRKVVKATFDGVSKEEMEILKNQKRVKIKDGLPFVPSFLFGFIVYILYSDYFINILVSVVSLMKI